MIKKLRIGLFVLLSLGLTTVFAGWDCPRLGDLPCNCSNFPGYCITTGSKQFTYYKVGKSLADYVAPAAGISLVVEEGGSIENVKKMRWQNGVKLAIVQSDVLTFYKREARKGNRYARELLSPLRVMLPLYNEEMHVLTSVESDIDTFSDLRGKRIALGKPNGGSAMTGLAIYELMFGEELPPENAVFTSNFDDSLKAIVDGKADAWIMVVGQPTKAFIDIGSDANQVIKLVKFDENDPVEKKMLDGPYYAATINASSYPWLHDDVRTITVKAFLITQKYHREATKRNITNFTKALCRNFSTLQSRGHSKWKEVKLEHSKLPGGWRYSEDVLAGFRSSDCKLSQSTAECPPKYKLLNLCD